MKKNICFVLSISLLFLCSCAPKAEMAVYDPPIFDEAAKDTGTVDMPTDVDRIEDPSSGSDVSIDADTKTDGLITATHTDSYGLPDINDFITEDEIDLISYFYACGAEFVYVRGYSEIPDFDLLWSQKANDYMVTGANEDAAYIAVEGWFGDWALNLISQSDGNSSALHTLLYDFYLPDEKGDGWLSEESADYACHERPEYSFKKISHIKENADFKYIYTGTIVPLPKIMYAFMNAEKYPGIKNHEIYDFDSEWAYYSGDDDNYAGYEYYWVH